uniref:Si:ch211-188c16.1 n=1 Tax=Echeneis naucrates TaxID=173247 RepID=A0A665V097_ECHNA
QCKTGRPAVAEKPKHLPPPGGNCSSVVSSIVTVENKTPVVPRVIFRDGLRASGGKRPISFPPHVQQTSPSSQPGNGDSTTMQSLKHRHMPLVLPVLPVKEQKMESPVRMEHILEPEARKEILPQTKIKKKGLLLPFKSSALAKQFGKEVELPSVRTGEPRPPSAPSKKPLPDLRSLGPLPAKPPRPPLVDIRCYQLPTVDGTVCELEPESELHSISNQVLDAPEFPEFENSEMETSERETVISAALELEALDFVSTDLPAPADFGVTDFEATQSDLSGSICSIFAFKVFTVIFINKHCLSATEQTNFVFSKDRQSPNTSDYKEQKKRDKQRLEKEKREQKEREKKENEMKKKFKVTGNEEPMYHAKVMVASKVRKNDLPVKSGDTVSIIRTTNCPKGKWLARDANYKYGYISVMNVELNIKEMLELGKKAQAAGRGGNVEADTISIGITDDSEEWACEDETLSPANESQ